MSKATKSFTTVNVTNILEQDFVQEYTDPIETLEKVEVNIPSGETVNLPSLVGEVVASDIAGAYLAGKGLPHYWPDLQKALDKILGEKKTEKAPVQKPVSTKKAPAPVVEDEGEDNGEDLGDEGSEGSDEGTGSDTGTGNEESPAPTKAKTKR